VPVVSDYREDWKPVLTINSIIYGLQYLFLVCEYTMVVTGQQLIFFNRINREINYSNRTFNHSFNTQIVSHVYVVYVSEQLEAILLLLTHLQDVDSVHCQICHQMMIDN